jgi:hypothetical protein
MAADREWFAARIAPGGRCKKTLFFLEMTRVY